MGFAKIGSEIFVNTIDAGDQIASQVIELTGGEIVIAWTDLSQVAGINSADVRGQRLASGGLVKTGGEFILNTTQGGSQSDVALTANLAGELPNRLERSLSSSEPATAAGTAPMLRGEPTMHSQL